MWSYLSGQICHLYCPFFNERCIHMYVRDVTYISIPINLRTLLAKQLNSVVDYMYPMYYRPAKSDSRFQSSFEFR